MGLIERLHLTIPPLPSANTFVNVFSILTGFTYRGLPARSGQVTP
jgi:hypothetical protein